MDRDSSCIKCKKEVRTRQHGILCDLCERWQHRTCETGITVQQYRLAVKGEYSFKYRKFKILAVITN